MQATLLICIPFIGAFLLWLLPWRTAVAAGGFALMVALAELAVWIGVAANFDFGSPALQDGLKGTWFADLGVSYHVGLFDFSLWLVGLTALVTVAAIGYGVWVGRDRPRAYFGLLLFLEGATIGVFSAQDLLLFYVFWEAMMIPLYVLIGVWGGAGRMGATIKFLIYTMAGSLLMLVAVIAFGLSQGTFDMTSLGTTDNVWIFLGFVAAFAVKAPIWPFHGWLPDAYREAPIEVSALLSGVISKAAAYGFLRIAIPFFPGPVSDLRAPILALAAIGLVYGSLLAFRALDVRGVIAYSSLAQLCLIVIGLFAVNDSGLNGAVLQMVNHGLISATLFLLAGGIERRASTGELRLLGGMARGRPLLATLLIVTGVIALAVPGSTAFAGEFLVLNGIFSRGWGWSVAGAVAIVLAAMYVLRLISAVLHQDVGSAVAEQALDLRPAELSLVGALVAVLLALSFWPAGITDHIFGGTPTPTVTTRFSGHA
ncbi:MAG: NADH-quinone oxidoreductase subunit M [Actinobacteria bacterium]|nr:MAG: NADH-quinone oxidoreductase subunit M [Actinomycetota bacterium]